MKTRLIAGDKAPDFTLFDANNLPVSLHDYLGKKIIVYFYPAANTPGCTKEACSFQENLELFEDMGYSIIGISPDNITKLLGFKNKYGLKFTLLSDIDKKLSISWGVWGEKTNYGKIYQGIRRSTMVISETGHIIKSYYNVKASGHVERVYKDLQKNV